MGLLLNKFYLELYDYIGLYNFHRQLFEQVFGEAEGADYTERHGLAET